MKFAVVASVLVALLLTIGPVMTDVLWLGVIIGMVLGVWLDRAVLAPLARARARLDDG